MRRSRRRRRRRSRRRRRTRRRRRRRRRRGGRREGGGRRGGGWGGRRTRTRRRRRTITRGGQIQAGSYHILTVTCKVTVVRDLTVHIYRHRRARFRIPVAVSYCSLLWNHQTISGRRLASNAAGTGVLCRAWSRKGVTFTNHLSN